MATKYRAVCKSCDFTGNEFVNPLSAKKQRNQHQIDTNYQHSVGIEIIEQIRSLISSADLDNPKSTVDKKGL